MADFSIKRGDTEPALAATLEDDEGNPVDLTNVNGVDFHMKDPRESGTKVDAAATVTDGANGVVEYRWASGDTDTPGEYDAEFEVTYSGGGVETFPNDGFLTVKVLEDIA